MEEIMDGQHLLAGKMPRAIGVLYLLAIMVVLLALLATNFVLLDVVVQASGILRPAHERTELRATTNGKLDSVFVTEGQLVRKGDKIVLLKSEQSPSTNSHLTLEKNRKQLLMNDLDLLTRTNPRKRNYSTGLHTVLYQEQLFRFQQTLQQNEGLLQQAKRELESARLLVKDRIIAPAEYADKETAYFQKLSSSKSGWHEQMAIWNAAREQLKGELAALQQQLDQWQKDQEKLVLYAPVSGIVFGIRGRYIGDYLQSGEVACSVIPNETLIAECYVRAEDIAVLKTRQRVNFRTNAFDHKQFGTIAGEIEFIDPDITMNHENPVFKIRCSVNQAMLTLRNGYSAPLLKGMAVQARFFIARRTVWQLFFDKMQNWLQPVVSI
jgi:membrane fusion protein, peptide pheromone/bacteriocin exporter